jgi:LysM repeat protein
METPQQRPNARLAAIIALIAAFIVLMVIIISSLGGGGSGGQVGHPTGGRTHGTAKQSPPKIYVVKPGDCCLSQIAQKTGLNVDKLEQLNPHLDPQAIHSGDRVKLR